MWKLKKKIVLYHSSVESEFYVLFIATNNAEWLRELMFDLSVVGAQISTIPVYCDNQATTVVASNDLFNGKKMDVRI